MTKIIGFCEGVTDPERSFELDRKDIALLAPTDRNATGQVLGMYAFKCGDCGDNHVRTAGQRTIEALVLFGVAPEHFHPTENLRPEDEIARDLMEIQLMDVDDIVRSITTPPVIYI